MQPTHARWEQVHPSSTQLQAPRANANDLEGLAHGTPRHANDSDQTTSSIFSGVPPVLTRKFMISDTYYESPLTSTLGYPGPDEAVLDVGAPGLTHVSEEVLAELPEECRQAFDKARAEEKDWKGKWSSEDDDHARATVRITYNM